MNTAHLRTKSERRTRDERWTECWTCIKRRLKQNNNKKKDNKKKIHCQMLLQCSHLSIKSPKFWAKRSRTGWRSSSCTPFLSYMLPTPLLPLYRGPYQWCKYYGNLSYRCSPDNAYANVLRWLTSEAGYVCSSFRWHIDLFSRCKPIRRTKWFCKPHLRLMPRTVLCVWQHMEAHLSLLYLFAGIIVPTWAVPRK